MCITGLHVSCSNQCHSICKLYYLQVVYCNCALFGQPSPPGNTVPRKQRNTIPRSRGASGARIVHDKLWKGRQVLKVFFKNPEFIRMWKCRNEPMTTTNILAWAAIWNHPFHSDTIPTLEMTEHIDDSDIRVQFQGIISL